VLQIQHLLEAAMAAFMSRYGAASVPDLNVGRVGLYLDRRPDRQRRRVEVGQHLDAATGIDLGKM